MIDPVLEYLLVIFFWLSTFFWMYRMWNRAYRDRDSEDDHRSNNHDDDDNDDDFIRALDALAGHNPDNNPTSATNRNNMTINNNDSFTIYGMNDNLWDESMASMSIASSTTNSSHSGSLFYHDNVTNYDDSEQDGDDDDANNSNNNSDNNRNVQQQQQQQQTQPQNSAHSQQQAIIDLRRRFEMEFIERALRSYFLSQHGTMSAPTNTPTTTSILTPTTNRLLVSESLPIPTGTNHHEYLHNHHRSLVDPFARFERIRARQIQNRKVYIEQTIISQRIVLGREEKLVIPLSEVKASAVLAATIPDVSENNNLAPRNCNEMSRAKVDGGKENDDDDDDKMNGRTDNTHDINENVDELHGSTSNCEQKQLDIIDTDDDGCKLIVTCVHDDVDDDAKNNNTNNNDEDDNDSSCNKCCPICLCDYIDGDIIAWSPNRTRCTHIFHKHCIVEWLVSHNDCPYCRSPFLVSSSTSSSSPSDTTATTSHNNPNSSVAAAAVTTSNTSNSVGSTILVGFGIDDVGGSVGRTIYDDSTPTATNYAWDNNVFVSSTRRRVANAQQPMAVVPPVPMTTDNTMFIGRTTTTTVPPRVRDDNNNNTNNDDAGGSTMNRIIRRRRRRRSRMDTTTTSTMDQQYEHGLQFLFTLASAVSAAAAAAAVATPSPPPTATAESSLVGTTRTIVTGQETTATIESNDGTNMIVNHNHDYYDNDNDDDIDDEEQQLQTR